MSKYEAGSCAHYLGVDFRSSSHCIRNRVPWEVLTDWALGKWLILGIACYQVQIQRRRSCRRRLIIDRSGLDSLPGPHNDEKGTFTKTALRARTRRTRCCVPNWSRSTVTGWLRGILCSWGVLQCVSIIGFDGGGKIGLIYEAGTLTLARWPLWECQAGIPVERRVAEPGGVMCWVNKAEVRS